MAGRIGSRSLLSRNLKRLREAAGFTQEALAERVGCSPTMVTNIETGRRFASPDLLDRIAVAFDVPIHELFMEDSPAINWTRDKAEVRDRLTKEIGIAIDSVLSNRKQ